jgi:hypothetical protein
MWCGNWFLQNLLLNGYGGTMDYLPRRKIAIAFEVTFSEQSFEPDTCMAARVALFHSFGADSDLFDDPACRDAAALDQVVERAITAWAVSHDLDVARLQVTIAPGLDYE